MYLLTEIKKKADDLKWCRLELRLVNFISRCITIEESRVRILGTGFYTSNLCVQGKIELNNSLVSFQLY